MTNREKNHYKNIPVSDTHFHFIHPKDVDATADILRGYRDHLELKSITLCSMSKSSYRLCDPVNNLKGLYCKEILGKERKNGIYLYGAPIHLYDERDTADGYLKQVSELYDMGVDGYKIMDGKPTMRKKLGRKLCDPIFDKMYGFIEEKQLPVKMHLADPPRYWGDKSQISEFALSKGWYYGDGTYPTVEELRNEVDGIMRKFPKLKLCLAHLGYMMDDITVAADFLDKWENTSFDLTPGASIYASFDRQPEAWRAFLEKYADRLYFGSDTENEINANGEFENDDFDLPRRMLEWSSDQKAESVLGLLTPMNLPDELLRKIYYENAGQLLGDARALNVPAIIQYAETLLGQLNQEYYTLASREEVLLEIQNVEKIRKYFVNSSFEVFAEKIGFPQEAVKYFEECYSIIERTPMALQKLQLAKESYLQNMEYKAFLEQIADETGIHLHSVNMILALFCSSCLKEQYEKSGFSEEFFYDNMTDVTNKLTESKNVNGIWGTWALEWLINLFQMKCIKLGRLQFKKGTCEFREPYKDIVRAGDPIIECHIPLGESLDIQEVKSSLKRAYEFYKKDFPDNRVIFTCSSWLLYTPLIIRLPDTSNIKRFSSLFDIVELEEDEQNRNFWRIFHVRWPQDIHTVKGENTLQKVVIEHIKSGGTLGSGYGVIVLEGGSEK